MRSAGRIVAEVLQRLAGMVAPGITTLDLDREADRMIRAAGAIPTFKGYNGYPASICTSVNDEIVHGIPSKRKLHPGDIVGIDCGATYLGYVGRLGGNRGSWRGARRHTRLMQPPGSQLYEAIGVRGGNRLGDVCNAVQAYVELLGYSVVQNYCGHGLGARCTKSRRSQTMERRGPALPSEDG
jgi:methionyl aminopeptidase